MRPGQGMEANGRNRKDNRFTSLLASRSDLLPTRITGILDLSFVPESTKQVDNQCVRYLTFIFINKTISITVI